jgi:TPR repeat protein
MIHYANAIANGLAARPDQREAMKWYQMAADAGNVDAMFNYALGLERGQIGNSDPVGAAQYYKMAVDGGHEEAKNAYVRVTQSKLPTLNRGSSLGKH